MGTRILVYTVDIYSLNHQILLHDQKSIFITKLKIITNNIFNK